MQIKQVQRIGRPSKRQAEVLQFISEFRRKNAYSPSLAEIGDNFGLSAPTIHQHISYLKRKNLLTSEKGMKRSIQIFNDTKEKVVEIPLMGLIAAGSPIEPISNPEPIEVPRSMLSRSGKHYALKVLGTSMQDDGIYNGDIVIVREQPTVENGEKGVVYLPEKNEVTLKKVYWERNRVKLVPANSSMRPFYEKNIEIQGKIVGVIRKYG